jgi:hypothetical protein
MRRSCLAMGRAFLWFRSGTAPERKMGHFCVDFVALSGKKWPKTGKKRPKSAFYCYLSVTYVFLYVIHYLRLTRFISLKK